MNYVRICAGHVWNRFSPNSELMEKSRNVFGEGITIAIVVKQRDLMKAFKQGSRRNIDS